MIRSDKRIESIELVEIGPFDHVRIEFPQNANPDLAEVHIFTGGNGCGKTTLLHALASFFQYPGQTTITDRFRGRSSRIVHSKFGHKILLSAVEGSFQEFPEMFFNAIGEPKMYSSRKSHAEWFNLTQVFNIGAKWKNIHCAFLPLAYSGQRLQQNKNGVSAIQEIEASPLENHLGFGNAINPNLGSQWVKNALAKEAFALRDNNHQLAKQHRFALDRVIQAIRDIAGGDFDFILNTTTLDLVVRWRGVDQNMDLLPDGLRSIISWITDVLMRMDRLQWEENRPVTDQPLILFLDEIDIHLHPKWQRKVLPVIQKLFRNAQIFVTTHSPFVVGSVQDAWVYKLEVPNEKAPVPAPNTVRHVAEEIAPYGGNELSPIPLHTVKPQPSGAGISYEVLLSTIFDIDMDYDDVSENMLKKLESERDKILQNPSLDKQNLIQAAKNLLNRSRELNSEELAHLLALQLRQLKKQGIEVELE